MAANNNGQDRIDRLEKIVESLTLSINEIKSLEKDNSNRVSLILTQLERDLIRRSRDKARMDRILSEIRELNADVKELAIENNRILKYLESLVN